MAIVEARERIVVASMRSASEFEVDIVHANMQCRCGTSYIVLYSKMSWSGVNDVNQRHPDWILDSRKRSKLESGTKTKTTKSSLPLVP